MFTDIVKVTGIVTAIEPAGEGRRVTLRADTVFEDASVGDSIAVSGTCLTVESISGTTVVFFLSEETLDRTWFSELDDGDQFNLERSLGVEDRLGGHFVQAHVEATSRIVDVEPLEEGWYVTFETPDSPAPYLVEKGYVTVEGMSLTVATAEPGEFSVAVIPETWNVTNLSDKSVGDPVNLEPDIVAKYVESILDTRQH